MSEEILKALMQLFAILTKQDGGVEEDEKKYVRGFLTQQLGEKHSEEYYQLFIEFSTGDEGRSAPSPPGTTHKLTSVLDSVRILGICKKINKTLNQSQKVVVLVRLYELVSASMKLTRQRLAIIETVADVFRISKDIKKSIEIFILQEHLQETSDPNILIINDKEVDTGSNHIKIGKLDNNLAVLRIPDVNLYFMKYSGNEDLFLNGLGIHKNRVYLFSKGSTIKVPKGKPIYYSDVASHFLKEMVEHRISFSAENLDFRFRSGEKGLRNLSFSAMQGNLVGILGASGSGKTTLLNLLSGIYKPSSGTVKVNGININEDNKELNGVIGYIPQDDLLIEELTVFENLYYNAKLCFRDIDEEGITAKVDAVLLSLGLEGKKNLKVGSPFNKTISGGQRKRLNIALELIREPSILFVDEPTSGLSSRDSENVMDLLRELTLKGKLIFVVIHQPSSEIFKMFDNVIILDQGGYMVYSGNPVEAVMYFKHLDAQVNPDIGECPVCGNVNPELIFNIIEAKVVDEYGNYTPDRKVSPEKWQEYYTTNSPGARDVPDIKAKPPGTLNIPGWIRQIRIFTVRDFLSKLSNRQYLAITLLEAPVLAFILSYIIRYVADPSANRYIFRENENIPIYIFMALIVALFLGLTVSAEEIFRDRKILKREKFLNLSRSAYLVSKIAILTLISAIQAASFVLVANNIIELREMTFHYWFAFFTTAVCANMLGLNISASFNSAITIYILIPLVIIPMMVLSGAMFSFDKLNRNISRIDKVPLLAEIMPTKWSFEALMVRQFKDNPFQKHFYDLDKKITNSDFQLSYNIPELENRLDKCLDDYRNNGGLTSTVNDLTLIKNEILKEHKVTGIPLPFKNDLNARTFDPVMAGKIDTFLAEINDHYLQIFIRSDREKSNRIHYLMENQKGLYFSMLDRYHNESVSDHVRKIYEKNKLVEYNLELVRQTDPIFLDPSPDSFIGFRSHFFAPQKYFMGRYFNTYWFNMSVIWSLSLLLYVTLYSGLLKKLLGN